LLHDPLLVKVTAFPLAPPVAATEKWLLTTALDGAGTVNVIVWLAWLTDWPTEPKLPLWLLSPE
jgi:hypothetical protein